MDSAKHGEEKDKNVLVLTSPMEQQIYSDLLSKVEDELLNTFVLAFLAEVFNNMGKQKRLRQILNRFFDEVYTMQIAAMDKLYNELTEEQKQKAIPLDRYKEIFTWTLKNTQLKYIHQLHLDKAIIIN